MSVYISARYGRHAEAHEIATMLQDHGQTVCSTWCLEPENPCDGLPCDPASVEHRSLARMDLDEIDEAIVFVALSESPESPHGRGGRHVEVGYAIARGLTVIVIGPAENLFHALPQVVHVEDPRDLIELIAAEVGAAECEGLE